jgi:hypothetical protein
MKESSLTKTTTQGLALGLVGATAMFAIELLMLPTIVRATGADVQMAAAADCGHLVARTHAD